MRGLVDAFPSSMCSCVSGCVSEQLKEWACLSEHETERLRQGEGGIEKDGERDRMYVCV